jgi:hypothetical protein
MIPKLMDSSIAANPAATTTAADATTAAGATKNEEGEM